MATKRQNPLRRIGRQLKSILRPLNAQEQDQQTWARVVRSRENLPEVYQSFFQSHIAMGDALPYIVLTPTYEKFGNTISGKLICVIDQALFVLDANAEKLIEICYPINKINYVEVSSKLLEFRVTINGVTNFEIPTSSLFRCSTVTDYLFAPIIEKIRLRNCPLSESPLPSNVDTFDHWSERNFKFMNLARHSILPGEAVIAALLQPEIHSGLPSFPYRYFRRIKSPTHACIVTERELILIREDLLQSRKDKYGSTRTFIPLDKIHSISISRRTGNPLALCIQLINQECFECLFDPSLENKVEELATRTRECMARHQDRVPG